MATPVWYTWDGDNILVWSGAQEGKVKRIRNNSRVTVAKCDYKGTVKGPTVEATANLLPLNEAARVHRLLNRKYWYVKPPWEAVLWIIRMLTRRKSTGGAYIEIRLNPPSGEAGSADGAKRLD